MTDPTPPFSALRALEAATRHRSFTWAARELKITHSAVSQAVRRLEAELGTRLFERRGGAMEPSEAARRLAESYSAAAHQLTEIIRDITGEEPGSKLVVGVPEAMADLWLRDRLGRLAEALPDIQVVFSTQRAPAADADLDLLITAKAKPSDQVLAEASLAPVCAPALAPELATAERIAGAALIGETPEGWRLWAQAHAPGRQLRPQIVEDPAAMLEAAARGEGVALTDLLNAQPFLARGELALLPFPVATGRTLALRSRAPPIKADAVERFAMWLKLELARDAALMKKLPLRLAQEAAARRAR
jgi:DNA-binding transcriptional LysR family regulator